MPIEEPRTTVIAQIASHVYGGGSIGFYLFQAFTALLLFLAANTSFATHFRIASRMKSMTAAVIVQLAQEGKLSLDDPVSKDVPGVPNGDNITIDELLKMRSGLYNYTNAPELAATVDRDPAKVWNTEELLAPFGAPAQLSAWYRRPIQQHQLHSSPRPHRREGRW